MHVYCSCPDDVDGNVVLHRMVHGGLVHVQDKILMTTSVVSARDLLCEVLEGLLVHLARTKLGLVGGHTVSHVVLCEKARNRHLASLHTFSQEID